jgi:hypothetical protein
MKPTRLPAPAMPLLTPHDEYSMAHLIERHIEFYQADANGNERTVALNPAFVRHYIKYRDSKLPVVTAIVTSPLVLPDGTLLATQGLDRERGIIFRLQPELMVLLPIPEDCTPSAVSTAMRFLTDVWLCDVATDFAGKCIIIAAALTILERVLLPERPAFFVTAGQRGGGKTTTLQMLFLAATGYHAPAAAWSTSEEERRKALFSYLSEGVAAVVWDNIPRGALISCPSIEKCLTALLYSDRVLGETGIRTVPATSVVLFTGNNIAPRGDLASRSLLVRLAVDRPDPENRIYTRPDPIAWTVNHRGNILRAMYTILLGNQRLRATNPPPAETRFKTWWDLVGSAVEYAAKLAVEEVEWLVADPHPICPPTRISFKDIFLAGETDEEQTSALATVLDALLNRWPNGFKASDVSSYASQGEISAIEFKAALEQASGKPLLIITPTTVTWRLKALVDAPVLVGERVLVLRYVPDKSKNGGLFRVEPVRERKVRS